MGIIGLTGKVCFKLQFYGNSISFFQKGKKWAELWKPELGVKGREGDKICQIVSSRLNVTSFPNQVFPRGIMVRHLNSAFQIFNLSLAIKIDNSIQ